MRIYWANPIKSSLKIVIFLGIAVGLAVFIGQGFEWRDHWAQIESRGKLIIAVRESEGIYWASGQEFVGFERDLIEELQNYLEIPIQVFAVRDMDDLYRALEVGAVDMAMPGTSSRSNHLVRSKAYTSTQVGLVHDKEISELADQQRTGILDPIGHEEAVQLALATNPNIMPIYEHGRLSAELFTLIEMQALEQAIVDERDFKLQQTVFPNLRFTPIDEEMRSINILFNDNEDGTLKQRIDATLDLFEDSGLLGQMHDRYFGQALEFDYVDNLTFEKHLNARLPAYEETFKEYAGLNGLDWRLLAAVAYQESHWRANAKSPTGVRGLMMITLSTAAEVGITNRLDPVQSTKAGAQYLSTLKSRVPARITEPDRTWFALASYNVGAGHLEDARKITELLGDDPDRWIDVRKHLPKLALKDYYPWTKYGYARGAEPVVYVANIRRFYEKLKKVYPLTGESIEPDRLDQLPDANVPVFPGQ